MACDKRFAARSREEVCQEIGHNQPGYRAAHRLAEGGSKEAQTMA